MNGHDLPEIFDELDDDMEPMRIYEPEPKFTFEEEQKINELAEVLTRSLMNDPEFIAWCDDYDADTIAMLDAEVN